MRLRLSPQTERPNRIGFVFAKSGQLVTVTSLTPSPMAWVRFAERPRHPTRSTSSTNPGTAPRPSPRPLASFRKKLAGRIKTSSFRKNGHRVSQIGFVSHPAGHRAPSGFVPQKRPGQRFVSQKQPPPRNWLRLAAGCVAQTARPSPTTGQRFVSYLILCLTAFNGLDVNRPMAAEMQAT